MVRARDGVRTARQQRILRFLARGPAIPREASDADMILLEAPDGTTIGAARKALDMLLAEGGTLAMKQGRITLLHSRGSGRRASSRCEADAPAGPREVAREARIDADGRIESLLVNQSESPLSQLVRRHNRKGEPFLERREFVAGERLRSDFTRGQLMPRLGIDWSGVAGSRRARGSAGGMSDLTDAALAARGRVERALGAIGPELSGVLVDVCCFLKGLERVEIERGWPVRSAKVVLKTALAALARHYEPPASSAASGRPGMVHWGAEDYRPSIRSA